MRFVLLLSTLLLSAGASAEAPRPARDRSPAILFHGGSAKGLPSALDRSPALIVKHKDEQGLPPVLDRSPVRKIDGKAANCHGRIEAVRQERALSNLDSDQDTSRDPLLILAVDRRIDDCEVLVMADNAKDIRPLPEFSDTARLRPAH